MKKILIIILIVIVAGAAVFGGLLYIKGKSATTATGTPTTSTGIKLRDFFPFTRQPDATDTGTPDQTPGTTEQPDTETPGDQPVPKLIQLSGAPVAGIGLAMVSALENGGVIPTPETITVTPTITLKKDLKLGSNDNEVKEVQKLLNQCEEFKVTASGTGSPGKEGKKFDLATENAVKAFQTMFKEEGDTSTATGVITSDWRTKLNAPFTCTKPVVPPKTIQAEALRYVEQDTGHVYETLVTTNDIQKVTATTIPRVHDATFVPGTDAVALRYIDTATNKIQTFIGTVPTHIVGEGKPAGELKGTFLPENISDLAAAPEGGKLFYLTPFADGVAGDIYMPATGKKINVFTSSFSEWKPAFTSASAVTLTTKASAQALGFSYVLNTDTKSLTKLIGSITGLTALPNKARTQILYSTTTAGGMALVVYDTATKKSSSISLSTISSKCVWGITDTIYCAVPTLFPQGKYPDEWYQGTVAFSDKIWKIDLKNNTTTQLADPVALAGAEIDAVSLMTDSKETKLFFINKKDRGLWALSL